MEQKNNNNNDNNDNKNNIYIPSIDTFNFDIAGFANPFPNNNNYTTTDNNNNNTKNFDLKTNTTNTITNSNNKPLIYNTVNIPNINSENTFDIRNIRKQSSHYLSYKVLELYIFGNNNRLSNSSIESYNKFERLFKADLIEPKNVKSLISTIIDIVYKQDSIYKAKVKDAVNNNNVKLVELCVENIIQLRIVLSKLLMIIY